MSLLVYIVSYLWFYIAYIFPQIIPAEQKYMILELIVNDIDTQDEVEIPYLRFKLY